MVSWSWHPRGLMATPCNWWVALMGRMSEKQRMMSSFMSLLTVCSFFRVNSWFPHDIMKSMPMFPESSVMLLRGKEAPWDSMLAVSGQSGWSLKIGAIMGTVLNSDPNLNGELLWASSALAKSRLKVPSMSMFLRAAALDMAKRTMVGPYCSGRKLGLLYEVSFLGFWNLGSGLIILCGRAEIDRGMRSNSQWVLKHDLRQLVYLTIDEHFAIVYCQDWITDKAQNRQSLGLCLGVDEVGTHLRA